MKKSPGIHLRLSAPWFRQNISGADVYHCGTIGKLSQIVTAVLSGHFDDVKTLLQDERETFGLVIENETILFAAMDKVTGYPVFLRQAGDVFEIASDVLDWLTPDYQDEFNEDKVRLYLASGYTLGTEGLFRTVRRLLPGEFCTLQKDQKSGQDVTYCRYYLFHPSFSGETLTEEAWEERLGVALDSAMNRVIKRADGEKIWIPLSAGYDSRAILAKLLSLGYDNVETFSYGNPGNKEALVARDIASKAGVNWRFISSCEKKPLEELGSAETRRYMQIAGGLSTTPALSEYIALRHLRQSKCYTQDDLLINGQSGDFLTGGHIPEGCFAKDIGAFVCRKHFSLFIKECQQIKEAEMQDVLSDWAHRFTNQKLDDLAAEELIAFYLSFEWQERQSHYVIQQHRAYDFLGMRWSVPLWDGDLMDLYEQVPLSEQRGQALYLRYLSKWNYGGLFDYGRLPYDPWPKYGMAFRRVAQSVGLVAGQKAKDSAYKRFYYWTDLNHQYRLFGYRTYYDFFQILRSPPSLIALEYLAGLREKLELSPVHPLELKYQKRQRS